MKTKTSKQKPKTLTHSNLKKFCTGHDITSLQNSKDDDSSNLFKYCNKLYKIAQKDSNANIGTHFHSFIDFIPELDYVTANNDKYNLLKLVIGQNNVQTFALQIFIAYAGLFSDTYFIKLLKKSSSREEIEMFLAINQKYKFIDTNISYILNNNSIDKTINSIDKTIEEVFEEIQKNLEQKLTLYQQENEKFYDNRKHQNEINLLDQELITKNNKIEELETKWTVNKHNLIMKHQQELQTTSKQNALQLQKIQQQLDTATSAKASIERSFTIKENLLEIEKVYLKNQLAEKEEEVVKYKEINKEKDAQLAKKEKEVVKYKEINKEKDAQLAEKEKEVVEQKEFNKEITNKYDTLQKYVEFMGEAIKNISQKDESIHASKIAGEKQEVLLFDSESEEDFEEIGQEKSDYETKPNMTFKDHSAVSTHHTDTTDIVGQIDAENYDF